MSYMNDDTDPFGVPYSNNNSNIDSKVLEKEESVIEYNLTDYDELLNQKDEFKETLEHLNEDINTAKEQLDAKIHKICDGSIREITFNRDRIIVLIHSVSLSSLLQLKEELFLKDIKIRNEEFYFKLYLIW